MKIAVLGTGAMGSVYAGLLADSGHEVWAIDTWKEHIKAIRSNGLHIEGASGDRVVRLQATCDASEVGTADLVIIATKAMHVESAAASARSLLCSDTTVLTIQNGLGSDTSVTRILGTTRILIGVVGGFGASIKAPGHVHHNGWEFVRLGEQEGLVTPRLERIAEVWREAGFKVATYDDIDRLVWEKLLCNVCFSGPCCVLEATLGEIIESPDAWRVASNCVSEAFDVACALKIRLEIKDPISYAREFGLKIPRARPSVLLDYLAGRKSEIDFINGAIPAAARQCNLSAPYNEMIADLVRAKEEQLGL